MALLLSDNPACCCGLGSKKGGGRAKGGKGKKKAQAGPVSRRPFCFHQLSLIEPKVSDGIAHMTVNVRVVRQRRLSLMLFEEVDLVFEGTPYLPRLPPSRRPPHSLMMKTN